FHRIEFVEADEVGPSLILGPGDRRLRHDLCGMTTKAFARRVQREFRYRRSGRQQAHCGAMTSKLGIDFESARDHLNRESRSHAVPDDHDLVDRRIASARYGFFAKAL